MTRIKSKADVLATTSSMPKRPAIKGRKWTRRNMKLLKPGTVVEFGWRDADKMTGIVVDNEGLTPIILADAGGWIMTTVDTPAQIRKIGGRLTGADIAKWLR